MASIQCIKCKTGIHYHGEPEGIEYIFIKEKDWDRIITARFDSQNRQYINGSSLPMLYRADTIESDFVDLIVKAWKCPECGTFMFYDEHGRVVTAYEEDKGKECEKKNETTFDLRTIIEKLLKKKGEFIDSIVCQKNRKLELKTPIDVNEKIINEFKK